MASTTQCAGSMCFVEWVSFKLAKMSGTNDQNLWITYDYPEGMCIGIMVSGFNSLLFLRMVVIFTTVDNSQCALARSHFGKPTWIAEPGTIGSSMEV